MGFDVRVLLLRFQGDVNINEIIAYTQLIHATYRITGFGVKHCPRKVVLPIICCSLFIVSRNKPVVFIHRPGYILQYFYEPPYGLNHDLTLTEL